MNPKKLLLLLLSLFCLTNINAQSKKELKAQNENLQQLYIKLNNQKSQLEVEKANLEKEKKFVEQEKVRLAKQLKSANNENVNKEKALNQTKNELMVQTASVSELSKAKQIADLQLAQEKLEVANRKTNQKLLIAVLSFVVLISLLLLYLWIARNKSSKKIEAEMKKSDRLLLNILPMEVAEELKNTSKVIARSYETATVLFADIKNFTAISSKMNPDVLIQELDYIFGVFDEIINKHNIEKIKIIGDCYMCVGGVPHPNETNPLDVVQAAIEMQEFMKNMKAERIANGQQPYEIRIGINTGPIVAGVIGVKKFAYDIWGDTVNVAARLEALSEPGKINISSSTHEHVKNLIGCKNRGKIDVKGKGEIDMYFVNQN